jgi:hypothetical protein
VQTVTNPYRILYVDDEEGLLDIGRFYLEQAGGITSMSPQARTRHST